MAIDRPVRIYPDMCCPECGDTDCQCGAIEEEKDVCHYTCSICGEAIKLGCGAIILDDDNALCSTACLCAFARINADKGERLRREVIDLHDQIGRMVDRIKEVPA